MSYSAWMSLAVIGGLGLTWLQAKRRGLPPAQTLDVALVALAVGVIGARLGYVVLHWVYFQQHFGEAIRWWRGGLDWHSGLMAGLLGTVIYGRYKQLPVRQVLDAYAPGLAVGCALGWLACHTAGCAYGIPVWPDQPLWFLAADLPDSLGIQEPRVAVQLLGAGWAAIVLLGIGAWLVVGRHGSTPGARFALFMCLYSAGMFALGFVRGDEMTRLGSLRLDQWVDLGLASASAVSGLWSVVIRRGEQ